MTTRYRIAPDHDLGAWSIVDTESWTSRYEDADNIVVATVYDGAVVERIAAAIEQLRLPRTIG